MISVVIPSIGRANLKRTLLGVRDAARYASLKYEIIVVDDSKEGAAAAICAEAEDGRGDLRVIATGARNIATARNAGLHAAIGEWVAFIDDDEWPEETWLERQLAMARSTGAAAVIGPVRAHYPPEAPRWIVAGDPYSRWWLQPGTRLYQGSTANALVSRAVLAIEGIAFNERFGCTGGEDSDLFHRLARAGGKIVSGDGVVHEEVSAERCSMKDLARRAMRVGQTYAITRSADATAARRVSSLVIAAGKVVIYTGGASILVPFHPRRGMGLWLNAMRNAGKIGLLAGWPLIDYYLVQGQPAAVFSLTESTALRSDS